jgi:phosphoesterase RecJ-like protein
MEEEIVSIYKFLPGIEMAMFISEADEAMDLNIALDTGDVNRLASRSDAFFRAPGTINIDHHITNTKFAMLNYVDANSASTGEIVFLLIKELGIKIDKDIAACLYTAIATDTGGFKYGNTTPQTHTITAELLATGIDVADISQRVFDNTTFAKLQLTKKAIELLELHGDNRVAVVSLTIKDFSETGAKEEDCDGIVNIGRSIEGVEVSILMKEKENGEIKVNFRSKTYVDVSEIASAFSGGGHKRAAGCTVTGNINDIKIKILDTVKQKLNKEN